MDAKAAIDALIEKLRDRAVICLSNADAKVYQDAAAALAALRDGRVPPHEPTEAMIEAGWIATGPAPDIVPRRHYLSAMWRAMFDAAPQAPTPPEPSEFGPVTTAELGEPDRLTHTPRDGELLASYKADAERYRFLREQPAPFYVIQTMGNSRIEHCLIQGRETLDAAIDTARAKTGDSNEHR